MPRLLWVNYINYESNLTVNRFHNDLYNTRCLFWYMFIEDRYREHAIIYN